MAGTMTQGGWCAIKAYGVGRSMDVFLYKAGEGLVSVMHASRLGKVRTGAASGNVTIESASAGSVVLRGLADDLDAWVGQGNVRYNAAAATYTLSSGSPYSYRSGPDTVLYFQVTGSTSGTEIGRAHV